MQEPKRNGVIVVKPFRPQPGMGPKGRGPEINYREAAAFREAVAAKKAKPEAAEASEEPALGGYIWAFQGERGDFLEDDHMTRLVHVRNRS